MKPLSKYYIKSIIIVNKMFVGTLLTGDKAMNMRILFISTSFFVISTQTFAENKQWTWFHRKSFSENEQEINKQKHSIAFAKIDLPEFTQLVPSFNVYPRPEKKGHFTFYAQVRNAKTKKWSKWHRMITWGAQEQKSFKTQSDGITSYHHVRLESVHDTADAFAIKIASEDGADLSLIKSFAVNVSNLHEFNPEKESIMALVRSVYIKGVPCISQFELSHPRNDGLCSPTSCTMLTSYLLAKQIDPIAFAEKSHDQGLDKYGSWPFNMAHAFEQSQGKIFFAVTRLNSFKNLYDHLCKGIPVVVSVRGHLNGAPRIYHNGHLLVVIGYDSTTKEVICHDPAVPESKLTKKRYALKNFMEAWERSHRLAYLAEPKIKG
jgi:peptidase C39-like protein